MVNGELKCGICRVGKAYGSRNSAPDDRLRVPTMTSGVLMVGTAQERLCPSTNCHRDLIDRSRGMGPGFRRNDAELRSPRRFQRLRGVDVEEGAVAVDRNFGDGLGVLGDQVAGADVAVEGHQLLEEAP